jgi:hypothetical protein
MSIPWWLNPLFWLYVIPPAVAYVATKLSEFVAELSR